MTGLLNTLVGKASGAMDALVAQVSGRENAGLGEGAAPADGFASLLALALTPGAATAVHAEKSAGLSELERELTLALDPATAEIWTLPSLGGLEGEGAGANHVSTLESALADLGLAGATESTVADATAATAGTHELAAAPTAATVAGAAAASLEGTASAEVAGAAAVGATAETGPGGPVDPTKVIRGQDRLQPEFRQRLERVIARMEREFGHEVRVTETFRDQARQNFLYEQGRTRPGSVVTWTRNSNHTHGRAADVIIDGTYDNPTGYQRLAAIAAEEGLRTLGPRDAGHIELPRGAATENFRLAGTAEAPVAPEVITQPAAARRPVATQVNAAGFAQVAEVARVAQVARPARVAEVAQVAQVAQVAVPGRVSAAASSTQGGNAEGRSGSGEGSSGNTAEGGSLLHGDLELLRPESPFTLRDLSSLDLPEVQAVGGSDAAERVARVLALRESGSATSLNQMLLRLDGPNGAEERIRVDLRGNSVDTLIELGDRGDVERLSSRIGELQRSLERQGLEAESLRVRPTQTSSEAAEAVRTAVAAGEVEAQRASSSSRGGSSEGGSRQPWSEAEKGKDRHDPQQSPQQRSRRDQEGEKNS